MTLPAISCNPDVMVGKPVIAGTRITVELLLDRLAAGESFEQITRAFPHLPDGSIRAAIAYASAAVKHEITVPLIQRSA